ncbi:MAG: hypothetical protein KC621_10725 [Myxococcales bacterium]|nr:hypothetical protein [Myxococcales bacterium]
MTASWCEILGIARPDLTVVARHPDANTFALLLCALLERGAPMTLQEVATRLVELGIMGEDRALLSLKRCRPGRPPAYRDGDRYHLDPYDDELGLWVFRLGLRPPRAAAVPRPPPAVVELPGPEIPLTTGELDEAWKDASLWSWSSVRIVLAVLDAHGGPLAPEAVEAAVTSRTPWGGLRGDGPKQFGRRGNPITVLPDGRWAIAPGADLAPVRVAVRARVASSRKYAALRTPPEVIAERQAAWERRRDEHGEVLERLRRCLLVAYPPTRPAAVSLVDVGERTVHTWFAEAFTGLREVLASYDLIGALQVRPLLRALAFDPRERRLAELGATQKTRKLNQRGRTLEITTELLITGSCGISRPFGEPGALARHLAAGDLGKLSRRLESDAKALCALYEYGRLHGRVRLRWGFLDEHLPAPWALRDEVRLHDIKRRAVDRHLLVEVVTGNAPGWSDPWARGRVVVPVAGEGPWREWLQDEFGRVDEDEVQRARLVDGGSTPEPW